MKRPIIVAEIGINHNGDIKIAKNLIALASNYGADYVKFQKKTPDICVPDLQKDKIVDTVFGYPMKYIDYKKKMEFEEKEYDEIDCYCKKLGMKWFASIWDLPSLEFIKRYNPPFVKLPSASITDINILRAVKYSSIPVIMSTGMSTRKQIKNTVNEISDNLKYILHTTSSYPTPNNEMNMKSIDTLKRLYGKKYKIGFSNHCADLIYTVQAYAMGAEMIEFHITLDRTMKGTDQWASIGPVGFRKIMNHINNIYKGWGDGKLCVQNSEYPVMKKLRR